jgi:hypothetical protein
MKKASFWYWLSKMGEFSASFSFNICDDVSTDPLLIVSSFSVSSSRFGFVCVSSVDVVGSAVSETTYYCKQNIPN